MHLHKTRRSLLFVGPSVSAADLARLLSPGVEVRPPICRGDLPEALKDSDIRGIAIIDGEFFQKLAVSPKEILWALKRGIFIVGGASMGALRATELSPYGMIGVGQVFEWYSKNIVTRDDDVAVSYVALGSTYLLLNVAMVQVLWITQKGKELRWISKKSAENILRAARRIHWKNRTWDLVLRQAGIEETEYCKMIEAAKLPSLDIKRVDAIATINELNLRMTNDDPTRSKQTS
jgi:hypothetical protein